MTLQNGHNINFKISRICIFYLWLWLELCFLCFVCPRHIVFSGPYRTISLMIYGIINFQVHIAPCLWFTESVIFRSIAAFLINSRKPRFQIILSKNANSHEMLLNTSVFHKEIFISMVISHMALPGCWIISLDDKNVYCVQQQSNIVGHSLMYIFIVQWSNIKCVPTK